MPATASVLTPADTETKVDRSGECLTKREALRRLENARNRIDSDSSVGRTQLHGELKHEMTSWRVHSLWDELVLLELGCRGWLPICWPDRKLLLRAFIGRKPVLPVVALLLYVLFFCGCAGGSDCGVSSRVRVSRCGVDSFSRLLPVECENTNFGLRCRCALVGSATASSE